MIHINRGRMRFIWTDEAEELYQQLENIDEIEWRYYRSTAFGATQYFMAYIDGVAVMHPTSRCESTDNPNVENRILGKLLELLCSRADKLQHMSRIEWRKFSSKDINTAKDWQEFDLIKKEPPCEFL